MDQSPIISVADLPSIIREIPDFPQKGINFKDVTTLLKDPLALDVALNGLSEPFLAMDIDYVVGIESRGFMFGVTAAQMLRAGFVPIRKAGKLPGKTIETDYELEYGVGRVAIHEDALKPGDKVVLLDDLLATGGTMAAAIELVEKCGAEIVGISFLIELKHLKGREKMKDYPVYSLVKY